MNTGTKNILKWSGLSGLVAASCCTIPLLLLIFGLSATAAGALNIYLISLRWVLLIPLGLITVGVGIYFYTKKSHGTCNINNLKRNKNIARSH